MNRIKAVSIQVKKSTKKLELTAATEGNGSCALNR